MSGFNWITVVDLELREVCVANSMSGERDIT